MAGGVRVAMKKDKRKLIFLGGMIVGYVIGIISIIISMTIKMSKQSEYINANTEAKIEQKQDREEQVELTVTLENGISDKEIQWIGEKIVEIDGIIECDYVTSDEAWEQFKKAYFSDNPELAEKGFATDPSSPISGYYEVNTSTDKTEYVIKTIQQIEGVKGIAPI